MASRTLFRRLLQVNRRVLLHRSGAIRPLVAAHHVPQGPTPIQNSITIRGLCSKPGDGMIINIQSKEDFENRVVNNPLPVVVDFHASWCGPCKLLGPRLEALIGKNEGKVVLARIDVDEEDELAMAYAINSIPTVIGFKNKEVCDKFIGLKEDEVIEEFIDRLIEK